MHIVVDRSMSFNGCTVRVDSRRTLNEGIVWVHWQLSLLNFFEEHIVVVVNADW